MTDEDERDEWLVDKATFCVLLRVAPSEYDELTLEEREAFMHVFNDLRERGQI